MLNKKSLKYLAPFIVFFILVLLWHFAINPFGDDIYFKAYYPFLFNMDSSNFLYYRFTKWSWRLLIEFLLTILCEYPILWIIGDSILITLLAYLTPRLITKNFDEIENKNIYNLLGIVLTVIFIYSSYTALRSAGFIATSLNYTWPFIMGVLHLYLFKEYFYQKKETKTYKKVIIGIISIISLIFAINMEIVLISIIMTYLIFILYKCLKGNKSFFKNLIDLMKSNKIILLYLLIILLMLIFFIKCPGNRARFIEETGNWGDYSVLRFRYKVDLSFTAIYCMLLTTKDIIVYLFLWVSAIYASKLTNKKLTKFITFIPVIILTSVYLLSFVNGISGLIRFSVIIGYEPYGLVSHGISQLSLILASSYIVFVLSILFTLYTIYKNDKKTGSVISVLVLIAFISQFVIGFSPSCIIWTYPASDYPGRWWIIFNGIQIFTTAILLLKINENSSFFENNKKIKKIKEKL